MGLRWSIVLRSSPSEYYETSGRYSRNCRASVGFTTQRPVGAADVCHRSLPCIGRMTERASWTRAANVAGRWSFPLPPWPYARLGFPAVADLRGLPPEAADPIASLRSRRQPLDSLPFEATSCCPDRGFAHDVLPRHQQSRPPLMGFDSARDVTASALPLAPPSTALSSASREVTSCVYSQPIAFATDLRP